MNDESNFIKYRTQITEVTAIKSQKYWGEGNEILSLDGRRAAINSFIICLANDSETGGPFFLNATCARKPCARLTSEGFGAQSP